MLYLGWCNLPTHGTILYFCGAMLHWFNLHRKIITILKGKATHMYPSHNGKDLPNHCHNGWNPGWKYQYIHKKQEINKRESTKQITHAKWKVNRSKGFVQPKLCSKWRIQGGVHQCLFVMTAISMTATSTQLQSTNLFDTDSGPIGIDNQCTASSEWQNKITNCNWNKNSLLL